MAITDGVNQTGHIGSTDNLHQSNHNDKALPHRPESMVAAVGTATSAAELAKSNLDTAGGLARNESVKATFGFNITWGEDEFVAPANGYGIDDDEEEFLSMPGNQDDAAAASKRDSAGSYDSTHGLDTSRKPAPRDSIGSENSDYTINQETFTSASKQKAPTPSLHNTDQARGSFDLPTKTSGYGIQEEEEIGTPKWMPNSTSSSSEFAMGPEPLSPDFEQAFDTDLPYDATSQRGSIEFPESPVGLPKAHNEQTLPSFTYQAPTPPRTSVASPQIQTRAFNPITNRGFNPITENTYPRGYKAARQDRHAPSDLNTNLTTTQRPAIEITSTSLRPSRAVLREQVSLTATNLRPSRRVLEHMDSPPVASGSQSRNPNPSLGERSNTSSKPLSARERLEALKGIDYTKVSGDITPTFNSPMERFRGNSTQITNLPRHSRNQALSPLVDSESVEQEEMVRQAQGTDLVGTRGTDRATRRSPTARLTNTLKAVDKFCKNFMTSPAKGAAKLYAEMTKYLFNKSESFAKKYPDLALVLGTGVLVGSIALAAETAGIGLVAFPVTMPIAAGLIHGAMTAKGEAKELDGRSSKYLNLSRNIKEKVSDKASEYLYRNPRESVREITRLDGSQRDSRLTAETQYGIGHTRETNDFGIEGSVNHQQDEDSHIPKSGQMEFTEAIGQDNTQPKDTISRRDGRPVSNVAFSFREV